MIRGRRHRRPSGRQPIAGEGFLIEFLSVGNSVKVSAVDPVTGTEVSISGPPQYGERVLAMNAARKLRYVLKRQAEKTTVNKRNHRK